MSYLPKAYYDLMILRYPMEYELISVNPLYHVSNPAKYNENSYSL